MLKCTHLVSIFNTLVHSLKYNIQGGKQTSQYPINSETLMINALKIDEGGRSIRFDSAATSNSLNEPRKNTTGNSANSVGVRIQGRSELYVKVDRNRNHALFTSRPGHVHRSYDESLGGGIPTFVRRACLILF